MGAFAALVWKEWRDVRAVTLAAAALVPVAVGVLAWATRAVEQGELLALFALPALAGLYWVALASDLVAGDATSGRLETLAALPVRPWTLFGAKLAFATCAGLVFALWVVAVELAVLAAFGRASSFDAFAGALPDALAILAVCACGAAATAFVSTILAGGVAAVGLACVGLGTGGWLVFEQAARWSYPYDGREVAWAAVVVSAALVVAAWIAFAHGRVHLRSKLRPATLGLVTLALVLAVPSSAVAWRASRWLELVPHNDEARIEAIRPSPDGLWLALAVRHASADEREALWLLEVRTGEVRVAGGDGARYAGWTRDGLLQIASRGPEGEGPRRVDPSTLEVVARPGDEDFYTELVRGSCWEWAQLSSVTGLHPRTYRVERRGGGPSIELERERPYPQRAPGLVLHENERGGVDLVDVDTGERREVLASRGGSPLGDAVTADGERALFTVGGAARVVELESGAVVAGPWDGSGMWCGSSDRFVVLFEPGPNWVVVDLERGRETSVPVAPHWCVLPDGRSVTSRAGRLELWSAGGDLERVLYERP